MRKTLVASAFILASAATSICAATLDAPFTPPASRDKAMPAPAPTGHYAWQRTDRREARANTG